MLRGFNASLTRRELLSSFLIAGGTLLADSDKFAWLDPSQAAAKSFQGGKKIGIMQFAGELPIPLDAVLGAELDGRLYTDLSTMTPENPITPTDDFYIRTRASKFLESEKPWTIRLGGFVQKPVNLAFEHLKGMEKPAGVHLMECAGNSRGFHFGMMSVASWTGVPITEVLEIAKVEPRRTRVLISGFDRYEAESNSSVPGASWVFTMEELKSSNAFLGTLMNGEPLPKDHGAPVRLVVPGWYGCTCIKWVNEITLVDENVVATSQMQEYAARTHQQGVPKRAREYRSAVVEHAAMPIRIERWVVDEKVKYLLVGILWGGSQPVKVLEIRFNPEEDYVSVDSLDQSGNNDWSFWTHAWTPKGPGTYLIRLRVKDPVVPARRLDSGYYLRGVEISEKG